MTMFRDGETVTRIRAPLITDRYGNQARDWSSADRLDIPGCGVAPRSSSDETGDGRQGVIVGLTVYAPPGTDITGADRVEVRGEVYEVDGEPVAWRSPISGWTPGTEVQLKRVDG